MAFGAAVALTCVTATYAGFTATSAVRATACTGTLRFRVGCPICAERQANSGKQQQPNSSKQLHSAFPFDLVCVYQHQSDDLLHSLHWMSQIGESFTSRVRFSIWQLALVRVTDRFAYVPVSKSHYTILVACLPHLDVANLLDLHANEQFSTKLSKSLFFLDWNAEWYGLCDSAG